MKRSLRTIANMLVGIGALGLFLSTASIVSYNCGVSTEACLAGLAWTFTPEMPTTDFMTAQTTAFEPITSIGWNSFVQLVSGYALFLAVGVLIILELFELHYLRALVRGRKHFSTS